MRMLVRGFGVANTVVTDLSSRRAVLNRANARLPAFAPRCPASPRDERFFHLQRHHHNVGHCHAKGNPAGKIGSTAWIGFTPDDRQLLTVSIPPAPTPERRFSDLTACRWTPDGSYGSERQWPSAMGALAFYAISPDGAAFAAPPKWTGAGAWNRTAAERFTVGATRTFTHCDVFRRTATLLTVQVSATRLSTGTRSEWVWWPLRAQRFG
jgi:hypothetical protein